MQNAVSLILKNISMFNKLGRLLKQQKILFSQNEHNLAILCEISLAILFVFLLVSVFFCADKINVTAKNCSVNFVLMHIFFYNCESGFNIYRFFNDSGHHLSGGRHLFQRKHK